MKWLEVLCVLPFLMLAGCNNPPETLAAAGIPASTPLPTPVVETPAESTPVAPVSVDGSAFTTIPDAGSVQVAGAVSVAPGSTLVSGNPVPATPAQRERESNTVIEEIDYVEEARRKRGEVWEKMEKLAESQWKLESEKFELELTLYNNSASPDKKQIQDRINRLESSLRPLRNSAAQYQSEIDQYNMIIRSSR